MASAVFALSAFKAGPLSPLPSAIGRVSVPMMTAVRVSVEERVLNEMPLVTRMLLAMSQALVNFAVPMGSNWTEQVAGLVTTKMGVAFCASMSAGLAASAIQCDAGK